MSCSKYADAIVDHACGAEIEPDAAAHLTECRACRQLLGEQRRFVDGVDAELQRALAIEPSPRFMADVMSRVERPSQASRRWIWWAMPAAAAAILALVVFASMRSAGRQAPERTDVMAVPSGLSAPAAGRATTPAETAAGAGGGSSADVRRPAGAHTGQVVAAGHTAPLETVEALVATDQAVAVARYLALVRRGALEAPQAASEPSDNPKPVEPVVELVVEPLTVDSVVLPGVERGTVVATERLDPR